MIKKSYKYPYNSRIVDQTEIFLSDQICEQVVRISLVLIDDSTVPRLLKPSKCKRQFVKKLSSKVNRKSKRVIGILALISKLWFSNVQPSPAMGLTIPAAPVVRIQPGYRHSSEVKTAPTINPRLDKIVMMANNRMIPLIYINGHYSYINEQLLKKLRAGNLTSNLIVVVVGAVVYLMWSVSGVDAFQIIANWNAPQPSPGLGFGQPSTSTSTQLSVIPTEAQNFNKMLQDFNQRKTSYNFVMSDQEAKRQVNEMYPGVLEIAYTDNTHISDVKAANKIYHASQLGVYPEDYGMKNEDVKRINEIGIYNYAKEGRPLPPIELIKDYQMAMKDICTNGKLLEGTYSSKAEQKIHKAIYKYDMQTRKVVGFYRETGELITATKYKESTFQNFILTKNLGTLN